MSLNEKSVLIVGGSSGIGLGVAEALLQEGATVTIVGRTQEKLRAARESLGFGDRIKAIVADVTNEDQVETPMWEEIAGPAKNQMWADMGKRVPAGRIAKPADIAKAYSFLLGSELTTGIVLKIDGGHALI